MKFFAGLKSHGFTRGYAHFRASARIAADTGFARTNAENTEAAQFNAISGGESFFESLKNSIDSGFSLGSRQTSALDHVMDNILLDQCRRPFVKY
jgi:hypothetical protein